MKPRIIETFLVANRGFQPVVQNSSLPNMTAHPAFTAVDTHALATMYAAGVRWHGRRESHHRSSVITVPKVSAWQITLHHTTAP